ncbi:hypothetical protein BGZ46_003938 [Entomortierella lignicola]|nr:hypothetical protein BGZ46_003938 [Entomortierella lignicola]
MNISIIEIPILVYEISKYLQTYDLANCVLVSKEWHANFNPRLWCSINFKKDIDRVALTRNKDNIGSIDNQSVPVKKPVRNFYTRRLPKPKHSPKAGRIEVTEFLDIVAVATSLQRISVKLQFMDRCSTKDIIVALNHHPRLRYINFNYTSSVYPKYIPRLLQICPQIHTLHITVKVVKSRTVNMEQEPMLVEKSMEKMRECRLKEFYIFTNNENLDRLIILPLLENCPILETLRLPRMYLGKSFHRMSEMFRSRDRFTKLCHLSLETAIHDDSEGLFELFQAVGYEAGGFDGLQSLKIASHFGMDPTLIPKYFSYSLTSLVLQHPRIWLRPFTYIMERLPHLRSLEVKIHVAEELKVELCTETMLQTSWACKGLINLTLKLFTVKGNTHLDEYIFEQVGQLTDLEQLRLDSDHYHLRLEEGYLGHLENLKRLKEIVIHPFGYKVSLKEAQWILDQWPNLIHLGFGSADECHYYTRFFERGRYKKCIRRLRSRRPMIQITVGGDEMQGDTKAKIAENGDD